jgi:hypothetical protein
VEKAMTHPYEGLPDYAYWRRAMSSDADPVVEVPFRIGPETRVATAGSCFAQHISRALCEWGYRYLVPEADGESAGVFPARFGNIYTPRQLLQTFDRAYSVFRPVDQAWRREDGAFVDPFRPRIQAAGFPTPDAVEAARRGHLAAVRAMFEDCDVFVFTLGLTEAWVSTRDAAVFPLAPGVAGGEPGEDYAFHNFTVAEMTADLEALLKKLRSVNPHVRLILTVSPVPLIATYEPQHILVSTSYSKAALRVAAEAIVRSDPAVAYFPSYEIITGPQARGRYFADDLRTITPEGVHYVMKVFSHHFLDDSAHAVRAQEPVATANLGASDQARFEQLAEVICDEEALDDFGS